MDTQPNQITRRALIRSAIAAAAVGIGQSAWPQTRQPEGIPENLLALLPPGGLHVIGFFGGGTGATVREHMEWYEGTHAPDFVVFAGPYLARYTRNYVTAVEGGSKPEFDVITEIGYKSEAGKKEIARLYDTPAAEGLRTHRPPAYAGQKPQRSGALTTANRMATVEEHLISGSPFASDPVPHSRRIVVIKRAGTQSERDFASTAMQFAREVARASGPKLRVNLTVRKAGTRAAYADGFVAVDRFSKEKLPVPTVPGVQVMHVLQVEAHSSRVS